MLHHEKLEKENNYPPSFLPIAQDIVFSYPNLTMEKHFDLLYEALYKKGLVTPTVKTKHIERALRSASSTY